MAVLSVNTLQSSVSVLGATVSVISSWNVRFRYYIPCNVVTLVRASLLNEC